MNKKDNSLKRPIIDEALLVQTSEEVWVAGEKYDEIKVYGKKWEGLKAVDIKISTAKITHCQFDQGKLDKLRLVDTRWEKVSLANASCYEGNWLRSEFVASKLTGMQIINPILEDIYFKECSSQWLQLRFGKTKRIKFENCNLTESDFGSTDLSGAIFLNCDLTGAEFSGAKLAGADLRGSKLDDIHIGYQEIKGATVTTSQALYLSGLLGIKIED